MHGLLRCCCTSGTLAGCAHSQVKPHNARSHFPVDRKYMYAKLEQKLWRHGDDDSFPSSRVRQATNTNVPGHGAFWNIPHTSIQKSALKGMTLPCLEFTYMCARAPPAAPIHQQSAMPTRGSFVTTEKENKYNGLSAQQQINIPTSKILRVHDRLHPTSYRRLKIRAYKTGIHISNPASQKRRCQHHLITLR